VKRKSTTCLESLGHGTVDACRSPYTLGNVVRVNLYTCKVCVYVYTGTCIYYVPITCYNDCFHSMISSWSTVVMF